MKKIFIVFIMMMISLIFAQADTKPEFQKIDIQLKATAVKEAVQLKPESIWYEPQTEKIIALFVAEYPTSAKKAKPYNIQSNRISVSVRKNKGIEYFIIEDIHEVIQTTKKDPYAELDRFVVEEDIQKKCQQIWTHKKKRVHSLANSPHKLVVIYHYGGIDFSLVSGDKNHPYTIEAKVNRQKTIQSIVVSSSLGSSSISKKINLTESLDLQGEGDVLFLHEGNRNRTVLPNDTLIKFLTQLISNLADHDVGEKIREMVLNGVMIKPSLEKKIVDRLIIFCQSRIEEFYREMN